MTGVQTCALPICEIEDSLRTLLGCNIPRQLSAANRSGTGGGTGGTGGSGSTSAVSNSRADVSYMGDSALGDRVRGVDGCSEGRAVHVNQMTGTVLVRAMPKELRHIERLLKAMQVSVDRQVIIEAKVIDVQLNRDAQQGINWALMRDGLMRAGVGLDPSQINGPITNTSGVNLAGRMLNGATMADLLGTQMLNGTAANAFSQGLGLALRGSQFSALLNFLETQGDVQVLSSPRIATLNNQKAVIKVGTEEPFITNIAPGSTSLTTGAAVSVPPTLTYQPFFSGISLDVTPQIDELDRVTLHVHALVNSITEKQKVSSTQAGAAPVPLAVSSVHETDSVVKTADGMMVVIGGLMMESSNSNHAGLPGIGRVPLAGSLVAKDGQASSKRELVILIKPTVVKMDSDWSDDIASAQRRIEGIGEASRAARSLPGGAQ